MKDRSSGGKKRYCCDSCTPLKGLVTGGLYVIGILALIFALWAWQNNSFFSSWTIAVQSGPFPTGYHTTLLAAPTPLTITMPQILTSVIGASYCVECISPLPHTIRISGGYTWDGTNNRATCNNSVGSGPAGFCFLVTGQLSVRLLNSDQVTYSLVI